MKNFQFARNIKIGDKSIGKGEPVFIIAELGVNHNGDANLAREMIDAAAAAGADAVKLQNYHVENVMADDGQLYRYESQGKIIEESTFAMLKRLELPDEVYAELFAYARARGLIPFATVVDNQGIENVLSAGADLFKIASATLGNLPLLRSLGAIKKPLILSTGMTTSAELQETVDILKNAGLADCVFLHCVSLYPTPFSEANLSRMLTIGKLTNSLVGYSDHTLGIDACAAAAAMGACVLEKHFTLDKTMHGPDQAISADPRELAALVKKVREVETLLGSGEMAPGEKETVSRGLFRLSIAASEDIPAGSELCERLLCLKRPGTGLPPSEMTALIGRKLKVDVKKDRQIAWNMIED